MFKLLLAAVVVVAVAADNKADFKDFMTKFNKVYDAAELPARFAAFEANLKIIAEHDVQATGFSMAINQFADLTADEFSALYKGYNHRERSYLRSLNEQTLEPVKIKEGAEVNWVTKGAVTPVKDQGQCGSCWSFSTTGGLEGGHFVETGKLVSLAEQQLVDCAGAEGNQGCNGGLMDDAFEYIIKNGGIGSEESYRYTARDGTCKKVPSVVSMTKYTDVRKGDEAGLLTAVTQQPVSIAVDAGSGWQLYSGGIMKNCRGKQLDHGVLAAGYGTDGGDDYWLVKNSWGASWGEKGYIRLLRDMDACGLADAASWAQ